VSDAAVIVGKWLGALGFFIALLVPTLAFVIVLEVFAAPDYGPILSGYVGLLLVGGLFLAIGAFASALTRNQIVAFVLSLFMILLLTLVTYWTPSLTGAQGAGVMPDDWTGRLAVLGVMVGVSLAAGALAWLLAGEWAAGLSIAIAGTLGLAAVWAVLIAISGPWVADVMYFLNVNRQYADFAKGLIDISNVTFFIGGIALFLVLATKTLESRKWR
jgi:ABC-type transport system involved in multi-copper enzyme maturation permease subunit